MSLISKAFTRCSRCGRLFCHCKEMERRYGNCDDAINRHRVAFLLIQKGICSTQVTKDYLPIGATESDIGRRYWAWIHDLSGEQLRRAIRILKNEKTEG